MLISNTAISTKNAGVISFGEFIHSSQRNRELRGVIAQTDVPPRFALQTSCLGFSGGVWPRCCSFRQIQPSSENLHIHPLLRSRIWVINEGAKDRSHINGMLLQWSQVSAVRKTWCQATDAGLGFKLNSPHWWLSHMVGRCSTGSCCTKAPFRHPNAACHSANQSVSNFIRPKTGKALACVKRWREKLV